MVVVMPHLATMNASAYPFYPSTSTSYSQQYAASTASSPSSPTDGAMDLSRLSFPSPNASFDGTRPRNTPIQRLSTPTYYHTMPQPSSSSASSASSHSSSQHASLAAAAAADRRSAVQLHDYNAEVPGMLLPHFQPHKRSVSSSQQLISPIAHHSHHHSTDSTVSSISSALSSSTYPLHSPQSSPPYSPRDDFSPPHYVPTSVKYGTAPAFNIIHDRHDRQHEGHDRHDDRSRRLSDAFPSLSSPFQSPSFSSASSLLPLSVPSSAASLVDPRAHDPERLHALISVVFHMEHTGQQQKFLSQLGILYKQLYPHLFVKGMLKDLVDHAVLSGLLKLTGPAGQQQVHLTHKARANAMSYINIPALASPFGLPHVTHYHSHTPPAHSPSPVPSPTSSPAPVSQTSTDDEEHSGTRSRSGSSGSGSGNGRHTRTHSVQYLHSARVTPNSSPMAAPSAAPINMMPALSIATPGNTYTPPSTGSSGSSTPPAYPSSSYPSFFSTLAATVPYTPNAPSSFALEEKYFKHEKPRHLTYMFHFRVHGCKAFVNKACPVASNDGSKGKGRGGDGGGGGGSSDCFDFHSASKTRRRVPRIVSYSNGTFWNYNACRCQAIEKEIKCEKGDTCRYSHNKEEIAYHPSRYKTQPCSYPARADGVCTRFGIHCAYAHGEDDIRKPIVLKQGMPHKLMQSTEPHIDSLQLVGAGHLTPSVSASEAAAHMSRRMSLNGLEDDFPTAAEAAGDSYLNADEYMTPKDCLASDRAFFLYNYAIKPCTDSSPACAGGTCPNYHYDNKRRRNPKLHRYSAEQCVNVRVDGSAQWKRPSCCPLGDSCGSAHTLLECMYHPSIYKTQMCSKFDERDMSTWKRCQWGRFCAHAHSRAELEYNEQCMRLAAGDAGSTSVPHIVYDYEDNAPMEKQAPPSYFGKQPMRDSKPPLPPTARSSLSGASSTQSSPLQAHSSLTSPAAISAIWSKPASNANSPLSSSSSSPAPTIRIPNPIQPRTLTPINSELTSFFTPLGPTVLRDEEDVAADDDGDSIIVKPSHHHFASTSSSSSASSPSSSSFMSPLHSWQSTPSGRLTPLSQQPYGVADELEPRFDSSFLDSAAPAAAATANGSASPSSGSSVDMSHLRALLNEESERSAELRAENAALKQQLALYASQLAVMSDKMNEMDRRSTSSSNNNNSQATTATDDKALVVRVVDAGDSKDGAATLTRD